MVTLLMGKTGDKPNAITTVMNQLAKHLKIKYNVKYISSSVYKMWLTKYNDDIVHSLYVLATPLFKNKAKRITTIYDMVPLAYPNISGTNAIAKLQYKLAYKNLKKADSIVSISNFTKNELIRFLGLEEDKIKTIYLGVDHDLFKPINRDEALESLGLNPDYRYISYVSNTAFTKNPYLLNKIEKVLPDDVRIIKTGYKGPLDGPKVINLGYLKDNEIPLVYNASLAFIHPSIYEGFGLVILEACACGTPIVAYKNSTQTEITSNGLVDTEEDFIERTLRLIDSPQKSQQEIKDASRFSWSKMAREYEILYEEIL
jgi:glycosyltransferase involved in cell wall biosynthesis